MSSELRFLTRMATVNPLEPVWDDLRVLNASLQRTLDEFRSSFHRASTAGKEMPDARVRLDHVLKLTEEAAHRTLDLVERSGPLASRMAQSYQDLSGQIIRTVIKLVVELERTLAHFSDLTGEGAAGVSLPKKQDNNSRGFGPAVPGVTTGAVGEQEDVDALLARMGM